MGNAYGVWRGLLVVTGQPCCVLGQRGAANSPHAVPPVLVLLLLARSSEVRRRWVVVIACKATLPLVLPGRGVLLSSG
jgi:hypothetical protein